MTGPRMGDLTVEYTELSSLLQKTSLENTAAKQEGSKKSDGCPALRSNTGYTTNDNYGSGMLGCPIWRVSSENNHSDRNDIQQDNMMPALTNVKTSLSHMSLATNRQMSSIPKTGVGKGGVN